MFILRTLNLQNELICWLISSFFYAQINFLLSARMFTIFRIRLMDIMVEIQFPQLMWHLVIHSLFNCSVSLISWTISSRNITQNFPGNVDWSRVSRPNTPARASKSDQWQVSKTLDIGWWLLSNLWCDQAEIKWLPEGGRQAMSRLLSLATVRGTLVVIIV